MAARLFTLGEAETLLPRLTELLSKMQELKLEHDRCQRQMAGLEMKTRSNGHEIAPSLMDARGSLERAAGELHELIEQVHALGCEMKGIEEGLIDFRARMEGREVYLCWKLGEERIGWWHDLDSGFAGRQRLPQDDGQS
jgi:hypothetical protein